MFAAFLFSQRDVKAWQWSSHHALQVQIILKEPTLNFAHALKQIKELCLYIFCFNSVETTIFGSKSLSVFYLTNNFFQALAKWFNLTTKYRLNPLIVLYTSWRWARFPPCFALCTRHTTWLVLTLNFASKSSTVRDNTEWACLYFPRKLGKCPRNPFKKGSHL